MREPDFKIYTGILRTARDTEGKRRIYGVASSTTKDLHGDVMELSALQDMERAAKNNMTIFLNHSYNVPEDVGGSVIDAKISKRDATHAGDANFDLDIEVGMNESNPRAVQTFEAIEAGTKLGISIGAMIPPDGAKKDRKSGAYLIEHVELLEASFVGIPANPRSWVDYAVKSLRGREVEETEATEEIEPDLEEAKKPPFGGKEKPGDSEDDKEPDEDADDKGKKKPKEKAEKAAVTIMTPGTTVWIDTDSTGDSAGSTSQEASGSEPGNGVGLLDETADGDDARLGDDVTRSASTDNLDVLSQNTTSGTGANIQWALVQPQLEKTVELLAKTTGELVDARKEITDLLTRAAVLERERDEAIVQRDHVLEATTKALDKISKIPMARKTYFVEASSEFRERMKSIYPEGFLKMMEERNA